jgi:hypothetical protein
MRKGSFAMKYFWMIKLRRMRFVGQDREWGR